MPLTLCCGSSQPTKEKREASSSGKSGEARQLPKRQARQAASGSQSRAKAAKPNPEPEPEPKSKSMPETKADPEPKPVPKPLKLQPDAALEGLKANLVSLVDEISEHEEAIRSLNDKLPCLRASEVQLRAVIAAMEAALKPNEERMEGLAEAAAAANGNDT